MIKATSYRSRTLRLVLVPLVLTSVMYIVLALVLMNQFSQESAAISRSQMVLNREIELANYTQLGLTAAEFMREAARTGAQDPREAVKGLFRAMEFGEDGYFFVYDYDGTNLAHPRLPKIENTSLWNMQDPNGVYVIRELIAAAKNDGGLVDYIWDKPSAGRVVDKIGYADGIQDWGWMVGTGLYIDDIDRAEGAMLARLDERRNQAVLYLAGLGIVMTVLIGLIVGRRGFMQGQVADSELGSLSRELSKDRDAIKASIAGDMMATLAPVAARARDAIIGARNALGAQANVLDEALAAAEQLDSDIDAMAQNLRPVITSPEGFLSSIRHLLSLAEHRSGIRTTVQSDGRLAALDGPTLTELFKQIEELVHNAERHAQAQEITVRIRQHRSDLTVEVRDDGTGFEVQKATAGEHGSGIARLREQVRAIGGELQMLSVPSRGTVGRISLPTSV